MEFATGKQPNNKRKWFFIVYFLGLVLILTAIGFMNWLGYVMINAGMQYLLFGLLVASALIGGGWLLIRRISIKWLKTALGILGALIMMLIIGSMIGLFQMVLLVQTPLHYTTLDAPGGEKVVLMRQLNANEARILARYEARGAEWDPENASTDDLGYVYGAYPRVLRFFYNKNVQSEGEVEIGCASKAQLMYEWTDGGVHLFIENPEPGDEGELNMRFAK